MNFREWMEGPPGPAEKGAKIENTFGGLRFRDSVWLIRGIGGEKPVRTARIGNWWTTNPYYGMRYGGLKEGRVWVAHMRREDMQRRFADGSLYDASIDDYPNYGFPQDPPNARPMTQGEIDEFRRLSGDLNPDGTEPKEGIPGLFRQLTGQKAIDATYQVLGDHAAPPDRWQPPAIPPEKTP